LQKKTKRSQRKITKKEIEWYKVLFEEKSRNINKNSTYKEGEYNIVKNKQREVRRDCGPKEVLDEKNLGKKKSQQDVYHQEQKGKNKDFTWITIWDLPFSYSNHEIRRLLKYYGRVEEIKKFNLEYSQGAEIKIFTHSEEQEKRLRNNWVIGLEDGKLARMITGLRNIENLKEREKFRAILTNIPNSACEALLFRMLQRTGAKAVYIPYNSNRNPSRVAKVFFETREEMESALKKNIFYYNTKLFWRNHIESSVSKRDKESSFRFPNRIEDKKKKTEIAEQASRFQAIENSNHERRKENIKPPKNKILEEKLRKLRVNIDSLNAEFTTLSWELNRENKSSEEREKKEYRS
jgi:hypothetical protein